MPGVHAEIPRFILGAMLLILAITQTFRESVNMYKATKQWQPNRYMKRLARDGIIYFLVYVSISPSRFHASSPRSPTHPALEYLQTN